MLMQLQSFVTLLLPLACTVTSAALAVQSAMHDTRSKQMDIDNRSFLKTNAARKGKEAPNIDAIATDSVAQYLDQQDNNGPSDPSLAAIATDTVAHIDRQRNGLANHGMAQTDCNNLDQTNCDNHATTQTDCKYHTDCWSCFDTYRRHFCTQCVVQAAGPLWNETCALDTTLLASGKQLRDTYCEEFALAGTPGLKEQCWFQDSTYKRLYCENSHPGFIDRCADDSDLGEDYCKESARSLQGYARCNHHPSFMQEWCTTKASAHTFDAVCAADATLGSDFCLHFAEEVNITSDCTPHAAYMIQYCTKRASESTASNTCATHPSTQGLYCALLAGQREEIAPCWNAPGFRSMYCQQVHYADVQCGSSDAATTQAPASLLENAAAHQSEASAEDNGISAETSMEEEQEDAAFMPIPSVRDRDTKSMDFRLPEGWKSGWDEKHERFFYFPVENVHGALEPVPGFAPTWFEPTTPWLSSDGPDDGGKLLEQNIRQYLESLDSHQHQTAKKTFGINAGLKIWQSRQKEYKRLHSQKKTTPFTFAIPTQSGALQQENAAFAQPIDPRKRASVLIRRDDGMIDFPGTLPK